MIIAVKLKQLVKRCIIENEKPEIIQMAEEVGYDVLFTPP
jgi:hypothetical protein